MSDRHDVIVVGAGIVGAFVAFRLASSGYDVMVIEKDEEAGRGVTSQNAGVIHVIQLPFKSLKSRLCIEGNILYHKLDEELGLDIKWTRSFIVSTRPWGPLLARVAASLLRRNLPGFSIDVVSGRTIREYEPLASRGIKSGVMVDGYGVVEPVSLTQKIVRFAQEYGANISYGDLVHDISITNESVIVESNSGQHVARALVNSAGLYADEVASLYGDDYEILPIKGVMTVYESVKVENILAWLRIEVRHETKGGGIIPHPRGVLLGPNYGGIVDKEDYSYTREDILGLEARFQDLIDAEFEGPSEVIVGLRPTIRKRDFVIEYSRRSRRVVNLIGIESPGLTAAPAIAEKVYTMLTGVLH